MVRNWYIAVFAALALAAPLAGHAQVSPPWSGPYAGLTLGFGGADMETSDAAARGDGRETTGFMGFNFRRGAAVYGVEADVTLNLGRDTVYGDRVAIGATQAAVDWVSTLRGRFGVLATRDTMYYGTAGIAYSDTVSNGRSYDWGYSAGLGFEQQIAGSFIWRGEAIFHRFTPDAVTATRAEVRDAFSVRIGLLRRF